MPSQLSSLLLLIPLIAHAYAHDVIPRHLHQQHAARDVVAAAASSTSVSVASSAAVSSAASSAAVSYAAPSGTILSQLPDATLTATDPAIPALSAITSGMPTPATVPLPTTATLGQAGPFSGFPNLPTTTLTQSAYPTPTGTVVPIDPDLVSTWLKELEGHQIPDIPPTNEGGCSNNTAAAADTSRCWWTCGGCTRSTDTVTCPDKDTWGLTFDDGPSPETPKLLDYLQANNLKSTFAVVGGSNYFFPDVLRTEYIQGHHIMVHTYRHPYMTTLSTPEVVAELGWTRKIIKDTIGVTPAYWRPPYGDVDDRVRAIAFAMGLQTTIWTRDPNTLAQYDTNDWRIPAGQVTGPESLAQFEGILSNATQLNTGFIVLEHDLYPETVDLAVGYTLPFALAHTNPKFNIMPVIDCIHLPPSEAYIETMTSTNRTAPVTTWTGSFITDPVALLNGNDSSSSGSDGSSSGSGASGVSSPDTIVSTASNGDVVTMTVGASGSDTVSQSTSGKSAASALSISLGAVVMGLSVVLGAVAL